MVDEDEKVKVRPEGVGWGDGGRGENKRRREGGRSCRKAEEGEKVGQSRSLSFPLSKKQGKNRTNPYLGCLTSGAPDLEEKRTENRKKERKKEGHKRHGKGKKALSQRWTAVCDRHPGADMDVRVELKKKERESKNKKGIKRKKEYKTKRANTS